MVSLGLFATGYCLAAVCWYLNHRFVFHGTLGKLPLLKQFARTHSQHHQFAYKGDIDRYIFVPDWGHLLLFAISSPLLLISPMLWSGACAFACFYNMQHYAMHYGQRQSTRGSHHEFHHSVNPGVNFSGIHPIIDRVFGTFQESK